MKQTIFFIGLLMLLGACSGGGSSSDATAAKDGTTTGTMVYDAENNFIGFYMGAIQDNYGLIYVPDPDAFLQLDPRVRNSATVDDPWYGYIREYGFAFESEDGSGLPYFIVSGVQPLGSASHYILHDKCNDKYYMTFGDPTVITPRSWLLMSNCEIIQADILAETSVYNLTEIFETDIPFPYPVPFPLKIKPNF